MTKQMPKISALRAEKAAIIEFITKCQKLETDKKYNSSEWKNIVKEVAESYGIEFEQYTPYGENYDLKIKTK